MLLLDALITGAYTQRTQVGPKKMSGDDNRIPVLMLSKI